MHILLIRERVTEWMPLHILELKKDSNISTYGRYIAVYHHKASSGVTDYEILLTGSSDLMNWPDIRVLAISADMPYLYRAEVPFQAVTNGY